MFYNTNNNNSLRTFVDSECPLSHINVTGCSFTSPFDFSVEKTPLES